MTTEYACLVARCPRKHLARGLCATHYHRWWLTRAKPSRYVKQGTLWTQDKDALDESVRDFAAGEKPLPRDDR